MNATPNVAVREICADDWPLIEQLFGRNGACGGCWCMWWRVPQGGKQWEAGKGEPNRRAFRKLVTEGDAHGIIALDGSHPVGWCAFGKRHEFPRLERMKAYARPDTDKVWSINCLYILPAYRKQGVAHLLADAAVRAIRRRRGTIIEAYPVPLTQSGQRLPAAFVYPGPEPIYQRLGFVEIQRLSASRPLYRLLLRKS